jgi:hypothetical protein
MYYSLIEGEVDLMRYGIERSKGFNSILYGVFIDTFIDSKPGTNYAIKTYKACWQIKVENLYNPGFAV